MVESLSGWLALREPADAAARSVPLTQAVADRLPRDGPVRVIDLASGTGSNIRYLAAHLSGEQTWLPVDRDAALLEELPARMSAWAAARTSPAGQGRADKAAVAGEGTTPWYPRTPARRRGCGA